LARKEEGTMNVCANCNHSQIGIENGNSVMYCPLHDKKQDSPFNVCDEWESDKKIHASVNTDGAKMKYLRILYATLACDECQQEYRCYSGCEKCIKCDNNILQGKLSDHIEALKKAIKALEEQP
jgi:hypothetical protein